MTEVSDEMLMAYADGELDPAAAADVRRAVDSDPILEKRLRLFAQSRLEAKQALQNVLEEPIPARLLGAVHAADPPRRWYRGFWLPMGIAVAASLVGGFLVGSSLRPRAVSLTGEEIAGMLETAPAGQAVAFDGGELSIVGTYQAGESYCRVFRRVAAAGSWRGVACRNDGGWLTELVIADGHPMGDFAPASGFAAEGIEAFLEAVGAGEALSEVAERAAIERGWRPAHAE
jgi:hypothetical protein